MPIHCLTTSPLIFHKKTMQEFSKKSLEILFHEKMVRGDLYRYVTKEDVLILLNRLPLKEYEHLKTVTFDTCIGAYKFGYVSYKRVNGIVLCDQPQRMAMRGADAKRGHLTEYGGLNNIKWPTMAVRRYMLYNVFLHELRHTQIVKPNKKHIWEKTPNEKLANEYSDHWRGTLYSQHFDHPDPVHNLPTEEEKEHLQKYWPLAMEHLQKGHRYKGRKQYQEAMIEYYNAKEQVIKYGEIFPVNHDLIKLEEAIEDLQYDAKYVFLSTKAENELMEKFCAFLQQELECTLFEEKSFGDYGISKIFRCKNATMLKVWCNSNVGTYFSLIPRAVLSLEEFTNLKTIKDSWFNFSSISKL